MGLVSLGKQSKNFCELYLLNNKAKRKQGQRTFIITAFVLQNDRYTH